MPSQELNRVAEAKAELPTFEGLTLVDQLANAQRQASACLHKYVGDFTYSQAQADAVLHRIGSWADRNEQQLISAMSGASAAELPQQLRVEFSLEDVRAFIVASYSEATRSLGPWFSGAVGRAIQGGGVNEPQMRDDAKARMAVFGAIVKWDQEGTLAQLFSRQPVQGLGLHPVIIAGIVVAAAIVLVGSAAVICNFLNSREVIRRSADLLDRMCRDAQEKGEQATIDKCIEMATGLQREVLKQNEDPMTRAIKYAALVAGGYVAVVYGLPALIKAFSKDKS